MGNNSINNDIAALFASISAKLAAEREIFNAADPYNGNHGDHMVEIFEAVTEAQNELVSGGLPAGDLNATDLSAGMHSAARRLLALPDNGSAQVYSRGLQSFGEAFESAGITLADLTAFVRQVLDQSGNQVQPGNSAQESELRKNQVLKVLVKGLVGWKQRENGSEAGNGENAGKAGRLNIATLFDLGIAYMQARQRSSTQIEAIADTAVSSSPLNEVAYRAQSGRLVIQAFLEGLLPR